ncbi:hypothetical protein QR685DRAFT_587921 [Neurospora intermedia]|uniref:Uncharacterized protein n=1 Tax=Neurospora intermedia TaxID=5142 RepID=A0ABR3DDX5_NEUIN
MASTTPGGAIHGYLGAQSVEAGVAEEDSVSTLDVSMMVWGRRALAPVCWTGDLSEWRSTESTGPRPHRKRFRVVGVVQWASERRRKESSCCNGPHLPMERRDTKWSGDRLHSLAGSHKATLAVLNPIQRSYGRRGEAIGPHCSQAGSLLPDFIPNNNINPIYDHEAPSRTRRAFHQHGIKRFLNCQKAHRTSLKSFCAPDSYNRSLYIRLNSEYCTVCTTAGRRATLQGHHPERSLVGRNRGNSESALRNKSPSFFRAFWKLFGQTAIKGTLTRSVARQPDIHGASVEAHAVQKAPWYDYCGTL